MSAAYGGQCSESNKQAFDRRGGHNAVNSIEKASYASYASYAWVRVLIC